MYEVRYGVSQERIIEENLLANSEVILLNSTPSFSGSKFSALYEL